MKVLVIVATLNEFGNVKILTDGIRKQSLNFDILFIDDSSNDGTRECILEMIKADSKISLISRSRRLGIGSAHLIGIKKAYEEGYEKVITLDADLSHDPAVIPKILEVSNQANYVVGTRWSKVGGSSDYKYFRSFLSKAANALCRIMIPSGISEYTSSYRCYDKRAMRAVLQEHLPGRGYGFFIAVTETIYSAGLSMLEYPIHFKQRFSGRSKIPKLQILYSSILLAKLFIQRQKGGKKYVNL